MVKRESDGERIARVCREWANHVKATPPGTVPCLINDTVMAYRVAMGTAFNTAGIIRFFQECKPTIVEGDWQDYMPDWVKEIT